MQTSEVLFKRKISFCFSSVGSDHGKYLRILNLCFVFVCVFMCVCVSNSLVGGNDLLAPVGLHLSSRPHVRVSLCVRARACLCCRKGPRIFLSDRIHLSFGVNRIRPVFLLQNSTGFVFKEPFNSLSNVHYACLVVYTDECRC